MNLQFDKHFFLSVFHIIFVVPFFLYIGYQRAATSEWIYSTVLAIGAVIFFYHGFKLFMRIKNQSPHAWVNAIHVLLIAPLLLYIGYHRKETPRAAYEMLLMLGFAAGGYHLFSLVKMLEAHPHTTASSTQLRASY
jgi:hypothetical protein